MSISILNFWVYAVIMIPKVLFFSELLRYFLKINKKTDILYISQKTHKNIFKISLSSTGIVNGN